MTADDLINRIRAAMPDAKVRASDMTGGGDHWQVRVESKDFTGKSLVEQHQMVYRALGEWMHREIHALALETKPVE